MKGFLKRRSRAKWKTDKSDELQSGFSFQITENQQYEEIQMCSIFSVVHPSSVKFELPANAGIWGDRSYEKE